MNDINFYFFLIECKLNDIIKMLDNKILGIDNFDIKKDIFEFNKYVIIM